VVKDYYALLGVSPSASADEIREAFLRKAEQLHPDRPDGGRPDDMLVLCEAVQVLGDPGKRALYDRVKSNPDNAITRREWESAAADASARAQQFPTRQADLSQWLQGAGAQVRSTRGGRILAGMTGGVMFGAVVAAAIGYFMELNMGLCAAIGAVAGACAGAFGAASNEG
jgi:curved DNA-binding protein CbpA